MKRYANQKMIARVVLEQSKDPALLIGDNIQVMLDELILASDGYAIDTLGIGGRWDALTDAFLISAKCESE